MRHDCAEYETRVAEAINAGRRPPDTACSNHNALRTCDCGPGECMPDCVPDTEDTSTIEKLMETQASLRAEIERLRGEFQRLSELVGKPEPCEDHEWEVAGEVYCNGCDRWIMRRNIAEVFAILAPKAP